VAAGPAPEAPVVKPRWQRWWGMPLVGLGVLLVFGWIADGPRATPSGDVWTVTRIIDGDTVDVQRGATTERVRVVGIDTPERGECGFGPASSALGALLLHEQVVLTPGARDDRDRYDRILRYVDIGETDAGLYLIEQGLAISRYDSRDGYGRHPREDVYIAADDATDHVCG
jgi:micrococcal nuclease